MYIKTEILLRAFVTAILSKFCFSSFFSLKTRFDFFLVSWMFGSIVAKCSAFTLLYSEVWENAKFDNSTNDKNKSILHANYIYLCETKLHSSG